MMEAVENLRPLLLRARPGEQAEHKRLIEIAEKPEVDQRGPQLVDDNALAIAQAFSAP